MWWRKNPARVETNSVEEPPVLMAGFKALRKILGGLIDIFREEEFKKRLGLKVESRVLSKAAVLHHLGDE